MDSDDEAVVKSARWKFLPYEIPSLSTVASLSASAMLARSVISEFLPCDIQHWLSYAVNSLRSRLFSEHAIIIEETEGITKNQFFEAVSTYLATRINTSMERIRVSKVESQEKAGFTLSLEPGGEIIDAFEGGQFKWRLLCDEDGKSGSNNRGSGNGNRSANKFCTYELSFNKKYKEKALSSYLPYIQDIAEAIKVQNKTLKIYTNEEWDGWQPVDFHHPATFDTLAMDYELKKAVMDDLVRFVKRKDYYKKIGKAWKRGYLLYGPPGTGKTSLIAAMANYLKFDIYDLELAKVGWNGELRRLLVSTANRSIIVVEDIDCSVTIKRDLEDGSEGDSEDSDDNEKVTLSGLLNFVDGLWSSCGEERIIVFTTNFKDRLDPALLRPGRMDMHIHMGYCSMFGFRVLASNYHGIDDHPLFENIEGLIKEVEVTPAEVAEELMRSDDKEVALQGLRDLLQNKKEAKENSIKDSGTQCKKRTNKDSDIQHKKRRKTT